MAEGDVGYEKLWKTVKSTASMAIRIGSSGWTTKASLEHQSRATRREAETQQRTMGGQGWRESRLIILILNGVSGDSSHFGCSCSGAQ
jgi:hypothetical protein